MWDVKMVVGKVLDRNTGSFTLTMWDVKSCVKIGAMGELYRFTLTMWDVKQEYRYIHYRQVFVLP